MTEWYDIKDAPVTDPLGHQNNDIIVWVDEANNWARGRVFKHHDGDLHVQADGYLGDFTMTRWTHAPEPPK